MNATQVYDDGLFDDDDEANVNGGEQRLRLATITYGSNFLPVFEGDNIIGSKANCQIPVNHDSVSEKHALIVAKDGHFIMKDLYSTNKTFVENPLGSGNFVEVKFGTDAGTADIFRLLFVIPSSSASCCNQGYL